MNQLLRTIQQHLKTKGLKTKIIHQTIYINYRQNRHHYIYQHNDQIIIYHYTQTYDSTFTTILITDPQLLGKNHKNNHKMNQDQLLQIIQQHLQTKGIHTTTTTNSTIHTNLHHKNHTQITHHNSQIIIYHNTYATTTIPPTHTKEKTNYTNITIQTIPITDPQLFTKITKHKKLTKPQN